MKLRTGVIVEKKSKVFIPDPNGHTQRHSKKLAFIEGGDTIMFKNCDNSAHFLSLSWKAVIVLHFVVHMKIVVLRTKLCE